MIACTSSELLPSRYGTGKLCLLTDINAQSALDSLIQAVFSNSRGAIRIT